MIDAHVHYWRVDRGDYGWLTPDQPIFRDFLPPHAEPLFAAAGIDGIVLVQAAATEAETRFMLSLAQADPRVRGVVGWIDMMASDAPDRLAALARNPLLRGIRPMWQDIAEDAWMLRPAQDAAYRAVVELGLTFDALARVRHLAHLPRLIERHPELPVVTTWWDWSRRLTAQLSPGERDAVFGENAVAFYGLQGSAAAPGSAPG